jgi:ureidoacrylate peracid hydrolase
VHIDTEKTAVVVVDMQNDFGSSRGMFDRAGIDITDIAALVEPIGRVLDYARRVGLRVFYLKMAFRPDLSDAGHPHSPIWVKHIPLDAGATVDAPDGQPSRLLIRDTWNTDIVAELTPHADDVVVYKNRNGGFHGTDLERLLRQLQIETLILVGATTSVCVETTVREAVARDFHCVVLEDCVAEPIGAGLARSNHDATIQVLELLFASISDSSSVLSASAIPSVNVD